MERNIERIAIALESIVKLMEAEDLRRTIKAILKKSKTKE
jgi:hypothetical protein